MVKWGRKKNERAKEDSHETDIGSLHGASSAEDASHEDDRPVHDDELDGNAMGLTRAFAPIGEDGFESDPFADDAYRGDHGDVEGDDWMPDEDAWISWAAAANSDSDPKPEPPAAPSVGALEAPEEKVRRGRHAKPKHAAPSEGSPLVSADSDHATTLEVITASDAVVDDHNADFADDELDDPSADSGDKVAADEVPEYLRKSRRMRRVLIVVIVLLVLLLAAGGFYTWQLLQTAASAASQQVQSAESAEDIDSSQASDASSAAVKKTTAPELVTLLGLTQDEAVEMLQRGAQISAVTEINEEGNPIKSDVRVALTAEPADLRTGTPTVYLGLDEDGLIIQAGYSASTTALGYGSLSFSDAVKNEHIVENTLAEVGVLAEDGSVVLPQDKSEYSTYDSDGKTLVKEYCSFAGEASAEGVLYKWSAVLSYDYSTANATGNLADTVRLIYVYVNV